MSKMQRTRSTMRQEQPKQTTNSVVPQKKEQGKKSVKRGKPARKAGGTATKIDLSGDVEVSGYVELKSTNVISIGTLTNTGLATLPVVLKGNSIVIDSMRIENSTGFNDQDENKDTDGTKYTDNIFSFELEPGNDNFGTDENPIKFTSWNNDTDVSCTWATKKKANADSMTDEKTDRGYYVNVYGQYFDGNTPESAVDDDWFAFWDKDSDDKVVIDETAGDGTNPIAIYKPYNEENKLTKKDPQWYFRHSPGYLIRTDTYTDENNKQHDLDILMIPSVSSANQIKAKSYTVSDGKTEMDEYTGEISYPFRCSDDTTKEIYKQNRNEIKVISINNNGEQVEQDINGTDMYDNNLRFKSLYTKKISDEGYKANPKDRTVEDYVYINEQIKMKTGDEDSKKNFEVHFEDTTYLDKSIKRENDNGPLVLANQTDIIGYRYNDNGVYFKNDSINPTDENTFKEQACHQWIINTDMSDPDTHRFTQYDVIEHTNDITNQDMVGGSDIDGNEETEGKKYTFCEKEVHIIKGKGTDKGVLVASKLDFRGCDNVELQRTCKIRCDELYV